MSAVGMINMPYEARPAPDSRRRVPRRDTEKRRTRSSSRRTFSRSFSFSFRISFLTASRSSSRSCSTAMSRGKILRFAGPPDPPLPPPQLMPTLRLRCGLTLRDEVQPSGARGAVSDSLGAEFGFDLCFPFGARAPADVLDADWPFITFAHACFQTDADGGVALGGGDGSLLLETSCALPEPRCDSPARPSSLSTTFGGAWNTPALFFSSCPSVPVRPFDSRGLGGCVLSPPCVSPTMLEPVAAAPVVSVVAVLFRRNEAGVDEGLGAAG